MLAPALGTLARALAQAIDTFDFDLARQILAQAMTRAQEADRTRH